MVLLKNAMIASKVALLPGWPRQRLMRERLSEKEVGFLSSDFHRHPASQVNVPVCTEGSMQPGGKQA